MLPHYRHRRGPYALAEPSPVGRIFRRILVFAVAAFAFYIAVQWVLGLLGIGNHLERKSVQLDVESRSNVTVSLEGGLMQRPDDRLKLWPDDRIVSNAGGTARITFFDGTVMRMDEQSELSIDGSSLGTKESQISATLSRGALWLRTPKIDGFSGSIVRRVTTKHYSVTLPSDAEVILGDQSILVFSADDDGITVSAGGVEDLLIGEGQQLIVPEDAAFDGDLRRYRSAMDPLAVRRTFIEESRQIDITVDDATTPNTTSTALDLMTIDLPTDGQTISGSTVRVQGVVGSRIERIRVNGYPATILRSQGTYTQELALPATETFTIRVEALDRTGVVVQQQERTVNIGKALATLPPSFSKPGNNGEIVRTAAEEIDIRGTAPLGTAAIYVNNYKLQLFRVGDTDWSYLASTRLGNLQRGENTFSVVAESANGNQSTPAVLTIIVGEAGQTTPAAGTSSSSAPVLSEATLPTNTPLQPGTIAVTAPSAGTSASYTGTGFLLEGTTIRETASMWINGYQLKLYTPGKTFWNYWALPKYATLKPGTNVYTIVSRDAKNMILDRMTYTVEYTP